MSMGGGSQQGAPQLTASQTAGNSNMQGMTSTNTGPWQTQQPFLNNSFNNASNLLNSNNQAAPVNGTLQGSWTDMTNQAQNTPSFVGQGNQYLSNVLNGNFLSPNSNPYLAASVQAAEQPILANYQTAIAPRIDSNSEMNNRYGSGEANQQTNQGQTALLNNLSNTSANMYSGAYNTGIGQMQNAESQIGNQLQANYAPSLLENQVGQQQQQQANYAQQYPWLAAQNYQGIVGGNYGQSGTVNQQQTGTTQGTMTGQQQQPYYSNPFGSIFGGALSALGTAGALGFAPFTGGASLAALPAAKAAGSGTLF